LSLADVVFTQDIGVEKLAKGWGLSWIRIVISVVARGVGANGSAALRIERRTVIEQAHA
jgi:hypothetical protein